jgi:XTP/dITP diphosphohydrolase
MKKVLVVASRNPKKRGELEALLEGLPLEIRTLDDYPEVPDPVEDGKTFMENAEKKALFVARETGLPSLADDSGLEVDALDGAPGVFSARYAGVDDRLTRDEANNRKLLESLRGVPEQERTARFRCSVAFAGLDSSGQARILGRAEGKVEGIITEESRGKRGFGYDPLFYHMPSSCTFAELPADRKNQLSHRARALAGIRPVLIRWIEGGSGSNSPGEEAE